MRIDAFGRSDVGKSRGHNEDFLLLAPDVGLFAVCDGMGGHAAGEVASETAARDVEAQVRMHADVLAAYDGSDAALERARMVLREAIEHANAQVREAASSGRGRAGMGTTCVSLLVLEDRDGTAGGAKGIMGHVGDSRLYMHRDGRVFQLSEDHTYVNEALRCGLLTPEQAKTSPYAHAVTRGVGTGETVVVDTMVIDILPGDSFLLCSDGLHEYFDGPPEIGRFLTGADAPSVPERLIEMANDRGGKDNITALVIQAHDDDEQALARTTQIHANFKTLRFIGLFQELSDQELMRVLSAFREAEFDAGQVVIREGDSSENLFVIVDGECEVYRHEESITVLQAGSHFGEMALLNRRPRAATVMARTDVRLLALARPDFNRLILQDASLATKLLWKLAQALSLRLDDLYLLHDAEADVGRKTQRIEILSPFTS